MDKELHFAFHENYGYINSNLAYIGSGIKAKIFLKISSENVSPFKKNVAYVETIYPQFQISEKKNNIFILKLSKTGGINCNNILLLINNCLMQLFKSSLNIFLNND